MTGRSEGEESVKIDPKELYSLNFYEYGEAYYGGCGGMRYRVAREPLENVHYTPVDKRGPGGLLAQAWPEPMSYAAADPSMIRRAEFAFSQEGLEKAVQWLNDQLDSISDGRDGSHRETGDE